MARNIAANQSQRSLANPLVLGTFSSTSLKYLKGTLKSEKKIVDGGYGGGTYNNWFQVNTTAPSWIIIVKGPPRPEYIQTSAYDLNHTPIQGESIFDEDSVRDGLKPDGKVYIPYLGSVMSAQSDLYNDFEAGRLDRGDERYYPLAAGSYLICISSTRNEPLNYEVGVVIEFPVTELFAGLEDTDEAGLFLQEDNSKILLEPSSEGFFQAFHDHSLSEWKDIWDSQHQDTDSFPIIFKSLTNRL